MATRSGLTSKVVAGSATQSLHTLIGAAIIIAGLYFGRDVLIPVALAILLTFLLAPGVLKLRRWGLPRVPAVITIVVFAFSLIGLLGYVVVGQMLQLADSLPSYQRNISHKLSAVNAPEGGLIERTNRMLSELSRELAPKRPLPTNGEDDTPIPVEVKAPEIGPFETLRTYLSPLVGPLTTAGVVVVLVVFMLFQREDLRDRFIGLVGTHRMNVTTQALDDAARRISRYLLMQFFINVTYGIPIGIGLYLIGVPNAFLWGVLAAVLRFVPFIGPMLAMALPLVLAFAVDPGWNMLLMTGALFLVVELISNNVMEPWLYGASTGISSVAIMVAAIFWATIWGPIGLLMSMPLTVCLAVAGRYVPQLAFLSVLLGNEPVLNPEVRLYQRMLAMDAEEASEVAGDLLGRMPLTQVYDELLIPALSLAETDRHAGLLDEERKRFIIENTRELVDELSELDAARNPAPEGEAAEPVQWPSIVCLPARDDSDEVGGLVVQQLIRRRARGAVDVQVLSAAAPLDKHIEEIRRRQPDLVLVSSVPPAAVRNAAYVCKRLRAELPDVRVHVGLWSLQADAARLRTRIPEGFAEAIYTRLEPAVEAIASLQVTTDSMSAPAFAADEARRLEALRRTRLLDAPPEEAFDRITRRLADIFNAPISLMSLVDENRQFWFSQTGLREDLAAARAGDRNTSLCGHVVANDQTVVVEDARRDPRFAGNPFVREHNIRFYAGAPLRTHDGHAIGSLCIIDHRPRHISDRDRQLLELMADTVMAEVEALTLAREYSEGQVSGRSLETDIERGRAVQALLSPPERQSVGHSVLSHRSDIRRGLSAAFAVTRDRDDGTTMLVIGDAGAGGISGPLMAAALAASAGRLAEQCATPAELLNRLNASLRCPGRDVPATVTAAVFSPGDGHLEIACAGHCPPILLRDGGVMALEVAAGPPLFTDPEWKYSGSAATTLERADRVLFYNEGVVDLPESAEGLLGVEGLARLAAEHQRADAETFLASLAASIEPFAAGQAGASSFISLDYRPGAAAEAPAPTDEGEAMSGFGGLELPGAATA